MFSYNYPRAALTVDAIIIGESDGISYILLICRKNDPFKGKWALPGGFIDMDETLECACKRELFEETGLEISQPVFFSIYDSIDRDPRGRTISAAFFKILSHLPELHPGDDASTAVWFPINELPPLAFDHDRIISDFIKQKSSDFKPTLF
jgi:8-oxo-dGTP diphosphatase